MDVRSTYEQLLQKQRAKEQERKKNGTTYAQRKEYERLLSAQREKERLRSADAAQILPAQSASRVSTALQDAGSVYNAQRPGAAFRAQRQQTEDALTRRLEDLQKAQRTREDTLTRNRTRQSVTSGLTPSNEAVQIPDFSTEGREAGRDLTPDWLDAQREDLENQLAAAQREAEFYAAPGQAGPRYQAAMETASGIEAQIAEVDRRASRMENSLEAKRRELQQLEQQLEAAIAYNRYGSLSSAPDFQQNSDYRPTDTGGGEGYSALNNRYDVAGRWGDPLYEYINRNEEAISQITANDIQSGEAFMGFDERQLGQMTDEEIGIFNYLYETQGQEAAYEYIDYLQSELNARQRAAEQLETQAWAREHPVLSSTYSVLASPLRGLSYVGQGLQYLSGEGLDANAGYNRFVNQGTDIRAAVSENMGSVGSFLYNTGMSMADFLVAAGLSGGSGAVATTILGSGAAAQTVVDAKQRGLSDSQAFTLGTISGVAEALTEKFSVDALLDGIGTSSLGYFLRNAFTEGSEEVASDLINTVADVLIAKDKSEWRQSIARYMQEGASEKEAFRQALLEQAQTMGLDFLGGALSGGVLSGAAIAGNTLLTRAQREAQSGRVTNRTAEEILDSPETMQELGVTVAEDAPVSEKREAVRQAVEQTLQTEQTEQPTQQAQPVRQEQQPVRQVAQGTDVDFVQNAEARTAAEAANDLRRVREAASAFGESGRRAAEAAYDGRDAANYYGAFAAYYQAGLTNRGEQTVPARWKGALSEAQRYAAYTAGQNDAARPQGTIAAARDAGLVQNENARKVTRSDARFLDALAKTAGVKIELVDSLPGENGVYLPGEQTIRLAMDAKNPLAVVAAHEVTHRLQTAAPEQYRAYRDYAMNALAENGDTASLVSQYRARYAQQAEQYLSYERAMDEIVADFTQDMVENAGLFEQLQRKNRTLAQRVLDALRDFIRRVKGALSGTQQEQAAQSAYGVSMQTLEEAAELWQAALNAGQGAKNTARTDGEARFSIRYDRDNTPYVVIEEDILAGVPRSEWVRTVKDNLRRKFPEGVTVGNNVIEINKQSRMEMTFSGYMQRLMKKDRQLFAEKRRATNNADEMVRAARNWVNEALLHPRKDTIIDFARGNVQIRIGNNDYTAQVIVGNRGKGGLLLYDIINLAPTSIQDRIKKSGAEFTGQPHEAGRTVDSSTPTQSAAPASDNNSIREGGEDVNRYSLRGSDEALRQNAALRRENELLRERVDYWKGQTRRTQRVTTDKKAVQRAARELIDQYNADVDSGEIAQALQSLYDYIASGRDGSDELTFEEARRRAGEIAQTIADNAVETDDTLYREFEELRKTLRGTSIRVSEADSHEIADYHEFRKRNFGRLKLTKGETSNVDQVYQELAEQYPMFFDEQEQSSIGDQLARLGDVTDSLYTVTEFNPLEADLDAAVADITNEILERFFDLPQTRATFADRQQRRLTETQLAADRRLEQERQRGEQRLARLREQNRQRVQRTAERSRQTRQRQLERLQSQYAARTAEARERRDARELRNRIRRHAQEMGRRLLRPSDKQRIPESFRKSVADVLESINLESVNARQADGKYRRSTEAFQALREQYAKIAREGEMVTDPSMLGNEEATGMLDEIIALRDTPISQMNTQQLRTVWNVLRSLEKSMQEAGRVLSEAKYARVEQWAKDLLRESRGRTPRKTMTKSGASHSLEDAYTFFSRYGEPGMAIYRMLHGADDRKERMKTALAEQTRKITDEKTIRQLQRDFREFEVGPEGNKQKLTLTTAHIMELYELARREQARAHLLQGGIVQPEIENRRAHVRRRGTEAIQLTAEDIAAITSTLTKEQKQIADALQKLMTGMLADWGNEASLGAYGYRKFTGTDYWPIHSAKEGIYSTVENRPGNDRSIANIGLAKSTVPGANNPVDIAGAFRTFARHAGDMMDYAAWLLPMEDATRLFNYRFRDGDGNLTGRQVNWILDRVGGAGSQTYWQNLMRSIQNGITSPVDDEWTGFFARRISSFKSAAVGANLRVVIQQPTALLRAGLVLSPRDMAAGMVRGVTKGSGWEKALRYSPIAQRKQDGGFDISNAGSMMEALFGQKRTLQKWNDRLSAPSRLADSWAWGKLWNAAEHSVARSDPDLTPGSEEFYSRVNEVFTDVIDQTQVVDGVLQRAGIMRSKSELAKQATTFRGEPLKNVNIVLRAYDKVRYAKDAKQKKQAGKLLGRAVTAVVFNGVLNAVAQSVVDAIRDDDKDKTYLERLLSAFIGLDGDEESAWDYATAIVMEGNLVSGLNPLSWLPFVSDVWSLAQGYEVARADTEVISDFVRGVQDFADSLDSEGKMTKLSGLKSLLSNGAKLVGLPVSNILRDAEGFVRTIAIETENIPLQYEIDKAFYNISSDKNRSRYYDTLFRALQLNDLEDYSLIRRELMQEGGVSGTDIDSQMRSRYKDALEKDPSFTLSDEAKNLVGILEKPYVAQTDTERFGADDLSAEGYEKYSELRADSLEEIRAFFDSSRVYARMDAEGQKKAMDKAEDLALALDLQEASDGEFEVTTKWMTYADAAERLGISNAEYALFRTAYDMAETTRDANGDIVDGESKQDHIREWLEDYNGLSERQREFLWGTIYESEW